MGRLILIILFFLLSLLCVVPAPTYYLWQLSVVVTEFPWIFLAIVLVLLVMSIRSSKYKAVSIIMGLISFVLFLSPVVGAYGISSGLNKKIEGAFGKGSSKLPYDNNDQAYSFGKMFAGANGTDVAYTTLPYSSKNGNTLTLDFYHSQIAGNRPCLLVVHGGSWNAGDSRQLPELNSYLAKRGYNVVSINYRLVPLAQSPAPVEDVQSALDYLCAHSAELQIDTNNFVLLGRSAGGQIVLCAAYTSHLKGLKGVIDLYGPTDMAWGYMHPANPLVLNTCKLMEDYLGGTYNSMPQNYVNSSATELASPQSVPTLIIHGQNDPLVAYEHALRLDKKLDEYGVKHLLLTLPWATHGCDYSLNGPSGQLCTYTIERFLNNVTTH